MSELPEVIDIDGRVLCVGDSITHTVTKSEGWIRRIVNRNTAEIVFPEKFRDHQIQIIGTTVLRYREKLSAKRNLDENP